MAKWQVTRAEQETVVRWDEEEKLVHVYSASPVTWRKMARMGMVVRKETTVEGVASGRFYVAVPVGQFRWGLRPEKAAKRPASPETRARLLAARAASQARRAGRSSDEVAVSP